MHLESHHLTAARRRAPGGCLPTLPGADVTHRKSLPTLAGLLLPIALLAACSNKASPSEEGSGSDIKTGPGVTQDSISLGVLTDLSGLAKGHGVAITYGNQLWAEKVNESGGICERQIELNVQDNGYKVDSAVPQYEALKGEVAGIAQILGSPILAALKQKAVADDMLMAVPSAASVNLDTEIVVAAGTTYDIEMINGMAFLQEQGLLEDGARIGVVYIDSELGQNALMGVKFYAEKHGLSLVEIPISNTDADMTTTITKLKDEGVSFIVAQVQPPTAGSLLLQNAALGLNVPILGGGPSFAPTLATNADIVAAADQYYIASSMASVNLDTELAKEVREAYEAAGYPPEEMISSVFTGYASGLIWQAILEEACEAGDLTREGILEARSKVDNVDTDGLMAAGDLTNPGAPSTRASYVAQMAPDQPGYTEGLMDEPYLSKEAEEYKTPYE